MQVDYSATGAVPQVPWRVNYSKGIFPFSREERLLLVNLIALQRKRRSSSHTIHPHTRQDHLTDAFLAIGLSVKPLIGKPVFCIAPLPLRSFYFER